MVLISSGSMQDECCCLSCYLFVSCKFSVSFFGCWHVQKVVKHNITMSSILLLQQLATNVVILCL